MMGTATRPRARFNVRLIASDMFERGWRATDLATAAGLSDKTIGLFLRGERQDPTTALKVAKALGRKTLRRYLLAVEAA